MLGCRVVLRREGAPETVLGTWLVGPFGRALSADERLVVIAWDQS